MVMKDYRIGHLNSAFRNSFKKNQDLFKSIECLITSKVSGILVVTIKRIEETRIFYL
jgi:hypothetical protein